MRVVTAGAEEKRAAQARRRPASRGEANCAACHSPDHPRISAGFRKRQRWEAVVNTMINAVGAPIKPADATVIADCLAENYGSGG